MLPATIATVAASFGIGTAVLFQTVKPLLEAWLVKPTAALHDCVLRIALYVCAVALVGLSTLATLPRGAVVDVALVWSILGTAAGAWLAALFTYHALNGDILGGGAPSPLLAPPSLPEPDSGPVAGPVVAVTTSTALATSAVPSPASAPPAPSAPDA